MCRVEKSTWYIFKKERCSRDTPCVGSCKYSEKQRISFLNFQYQATGNFLLCRKWLVDDDDANNTAPEVQTIISLPHKTVHYLSWQSQFKNKIVVVYLIVVTVAVIVGVVYYVAVASRGTVHAVIGDIYGRDASYYYFILVVYYYFILGSFIFIGGGLKEHKKYIKFDTAKKDIEFPRV